MFRGLRGYRSPLQREATFTGEHVLRRAAMNQTDVQRRVRRLEGSVLILPELLRDCFQTIDQSRGAEDGGGAERRISAVGFAPFDDHFSKRVTLAGANRFERRWLADDAVTHAQRLCFGQLLRASQANLFIGGKNECEWFVQSRQI